MRKSETTADIFRSGMRRNLQIGFMLGVMASVIAVMLWSLL